MIKKKVAKKRSAKKTPAAKPMEGEYILVRKLPKELEGFLPTVEEIEVGLKQALMAAVKKPTKKTIKKRSKK